MVEIEKQNVPPAAGPEGETILFKVNSETLPCCINVVFPESEYKCTTYTVKVYTALLLKQFTQLYLIAEGKSVNAFAGPRFAAPKGAIVVLRYETGSRRNVYHRYFEVFLVAPAETRHVFRDRKGKVDVEGQLKNLVPITGFDGFDNIEIEAEIANTFGAKLSRYDPVEVLYFLWIKKRVADFQAGQDQSLELDEQIKKLEEAIRQKEQELQALREQLQALQLKRQLEQMKKAIVK
ncbi:MAG: hypothetical protein QW320_11120 [Ignisphaera sp.]